MIKVYSKVKLSTIPQVLTKLLIICAYSFRRPTTVVSVNIQEIIDLLFFYC